GGDGVLLAQNAGGDIIGGSAAGAGNLISGNTGSGIRITDAGSISNLVQGNRIGTNAAGTGALPNMIAGVTIEGGAANNVVGGTLPGAGNLVSGNHFDGVVLAGGNTVGNLVQGNMLGTDATGNSALGNRAGVAIYGAAGNTIGGTTPGAG